MNATRRKQSITAASNRFGRPQVRLTGERAVYWRINGYRAKLLIWTLDEWENLKNVPSDAQFHPSGVWCALRVE
jgi:hypothetical protein